MSYFRHVIDRTLGSAPHPMRPAVTPDSIPESLAVEAKNSPASRQRKVDRQEKEADSHATAGNARKDDPHKDEGARIRVSGAPERHQEHPAKVPPSAATDAVAPKPERPSDRGQVAPSIPVAKEPAPLPSPEQENPALQPAKDISAAEAEPGTKVRVDKVLQLAPGQPPSGETAVRMQEPDPSAEPARAAAEEPPGQALSGSAKSLADEEKMQETMPKPEPRLESLRASVLQKNYTFDAGAKTSPAGRQEHPSLAPAGSGKTKYSAHAPQPEEIVVTINIGRIEVRAESQAEPVRIPRRRFSPPLSLADYLKQRSEGNAV